MKHHCITAAERRVLLQNAAKLIFAMQNTFPAPSVLFFLLLYGSINHTDREEGSLIMTYR